MNDASSVQRETILVVDDSHDNLRLISNTLSTAGYRVRPASDGELALRSVQAEPPALILLDIIMPGMDGFEMCRRLKEDEATRRIPVIFLSALADTAEMVKGFQLGALDFISKPFQTEELLARVRTHLELYHLQTHLETEVAERTEQLHAVMDSLRELNADLERRVQQRTAELQAANVELERAARLKSEFLANVSHELHTPLNAILNISAVLAEQLADTLNERQLKHLRSIHTSGDQLLHQINELLDFSRIEAGQFTVERIQYGIRSVCEDLMKTARLAAEKKSQQVSFEMPPAEIILRTDPRCVRRILLNLLDNAVKFTPEQGRVGLEVRVDEAQQHAHFSVWDNGMGISSEGLDQLFQPFVQLDGGLARRHGGTGLGLILSQRIARLLDGRIDASSVPGQGSRFTLVLPLS